MTEQKKWIYKKFEDFSVGAPTNICYTSTGQPIPSIDRMYTSNNKLCIVVNKQKCWSDLHQDAFGSFINLAGKKYYIEHTFKGTFVVFGTQKFKVLSGEVYHEPVVE